MTHADIIKKLKDSGYQAYYVGGCVRDHAMGIQAKDYDIVTDALPEKIVEIFPESKYINATFSVSVYVKTDDGDVEVTTMRREKNYKNGKPQEYEFTTDLKVDLARRDARFNAMVMDLDGNVIDPYNGMQDIHHEIVSAIGDPVARIKEHPIRTMRYARFASSLNFTIASNLRGAIIDYGYLLSKEKWEAVSKELMKGLSKGSARYIYQLHSLGLLSIIIPELSKAHEQAQNNHHFGSVLTHTLIALSYADKYKYDTLRKFAILLHDVGKMATAAPRADGNGFSFYKHEVIGADMAMAISKRMRLPNNEQDLIRLAVLNHMPRVESNAAARRFINRISAGEKRREEVKERVKFVTDVIIADKLAHKKNGESSATQDSDGLERKDIAWIALVEKELVGATKFSIRDLAVNGVDIMEFVGIPQGPTVGKILDHLLQGVMDDDLENEREWLLNESKKYFNGLVSS